MPERIKNTTSKILSDDYYVLRKFEFDYQMRDGTWVSQSREVYDRGDGACIFLYNRKTRNVVLIKQFRMPTFQNDNEDGFLIEACAGLLDKDAPEACIIRETREEVGIDLTSVTKVMEAYSSPGVMTEKLFYFVAEYSDEMKVHAGGGLASESEDIEVLEISFEQLKDWVETGKIMDAKTLLLIQYAMLHKLID